MSPSASAPAAAMTHTPDTPDTPGAAASAAAADGVAARTSRRAWAKENAPTAVLITVIVLLAGAAGGLLLRELDGIKADIAGVEADIAGVEADIASLRADMDTGFEKVDARFEKLEEGQQEIALTLAALVAYLRAGEGVDAALSGHAPAQGPPPP